MKGFKKVGKYDTIFTDRKRWYRGCARSVRSGQPGGGQLCVNGTVYDTGKEEADDDKQDGKDLFPSGLQGCIEGISGHFAAPHSHVTHYFDLTTLRTRVSEAQAAAKLLAEGFGKDQVVDTIVCLDGMEVVGAFLAEQLLAAGVSSMNAHETIYVTAPEKGFQDRFTFGENLIPLIHRKNVLVLAGAVSTGMTVRACLDAIRCCGGIPGGICSVFSALRRVEELDVHTIFTASQVPDYRTASGRECVHCMAGKKLMRW